MTQTIRTHSVSALLLASALFSISAVGQSVSTTTPPPPYVWKNVRIVAGGFITGLEAHPWMPELFYVRTDIGGSYRWDPFTQTWTPITDWVTPDNSDLQGTISIALDPTNPLNLYLAQGEYVETWAPSTSAIFKSSNMGASFTTITLPFQLGSNENGRFSGERLAVVTWSAYVLYLGTGINYQFISGQPTGDVPTNAALSANGNLYVTYSNQAGPNNAGNGQVWKYNVKTAIWTNITPPDSISSPVNYGYAKVVVDPWNPNTVMASTLDRYYPGDEIFRSRDAGLTWEALGNEPGAAAHSTFNVSLSPWLLFGATVPGDIMGNWIGAMALDPWDPSHLQYGTGATLYPTSQLGNVDRGGVIPWKVGALGIEETAVQDLISPPSGAHLLSALGDIGAFRHDNFNVSPPQGQFHTPQLTTVTSIDFAQNNPMLVALVGYPSYGQTLCGGD